MEQVIESEFKSAKNVSIASGYVSDDILVRFQDSFHRVAENGGISRLLVGMAFYEGLSQKKLNLLYGLHDGLVKSGNGNGVYVTYSRKFHGKIYTFDSDDSSNFYIGSSNFSRSGLSGNLECTALINDLGTKSELGKYIQYLFDKDNAVPVVDADITILGSKKYKEKIALKTLSDLKRYDPKGIKPIGYDFFDFPLDRIATKEKSNLNVYFGKGRWARSTGKITPRPWYEVELIAPRAVNSNPLYPQGDFIAYTDDGYVIPMKTSGDYFKNIRSKGNLRILGQWLKGKLQNKGALIPLTPITPDTLDQYGNSSVKFYKIGEGKYYMSF